MYLSLLCVISLTLRLYHCPPKCRVNQIFLFINAFIQQGRVKLINRDSKVIYNVTKDFYFK